MSKNRREVPYTEIVERVMELGRIRSDIETKVRGIVNDIYVRDIPRKEDWTFLLASSSLTFTAQYTSGNATIQPGSSTVTFNSDFVADSAMIGRKIKFTGNDYVYDITDLSSSTGVVIGPPLSGTETVAAEDYSIFQPVYPLNDDFERFPKNGGLYLYQGGRPKVIIEKDYQYYVDNYQPTPSENQDFCKIAGFDTAGAALLEVIPPPKEEISTRYDYYKQLRPMRETTSGVIDTVAASGTTVTGSAGTTLFNEATTGDYFRVDAFGIGADSEWYPIIAIAHNSSLTLGVAFGLSAATSAAYTICSAPDIPIMIHPGVMYGALAQVLADQDDPMAVVYQNEYAKILSDGKRIYKTREYSKHVETVAEDYDYRR